MGRPDLQLTLLYPWLQTETGAAAVLGQLPDPRVSSSQTSVGSKSHWSQEQTYRGRYERMWAEIAPAHSWFQSARWLETCVAEHIRMSKHDPRYSLNSVKRQYNTHTDALILSQQRFRVDRAHSIVFSYKETEVQRCVMIQPRSQS